MEENMSHPTGIPYDLEIDGTITRRDGKTVYLLTSGQVVDQPCADDVLEHWRSVPAFLAGKAEREPRRFTRTTGDDEAHRVLVKTESQPTDPVVDLVIGAGAGGVAVAVMVVVPEVWFAALLLAALSGWASRGYDLTIVSSDSEEKDL
jgi:hypothetical protein